MSWLSLYLGGVLAIGLQMIGRAFQEGRRMDGGSLTAVFAWPWVMVSFVVAAMRGRR